MRFNLKIVRFAVSARPLFISDFDKEDFGEFIKRVGWCQSSTLPERIMAFLKDADKVASFNDREFRTRHTFQISPFLDFAVSYGRIGDDIFCALTRLVIFDIEGSTGIASNDNRVIGTQRVRIAKNLFNGLCEFCLGNSFLFALNYDERFFLAIVLENDDIGAVRGGSAWNSYL